MRSELLVVYKRVCGARHYDPASYKFGRTWRLLWLATLGAGITLGACAAPLYFAAPAFLDNHGGLAALFMFGTMLAGVVTTTLVLVRLAQVSRTGADSQ